MNNHSAKWMNFHQKGFIPYVKLWPQSSFYFSHLPIASLLYLQYKTGQISMDENTVVSKALVKFKCYPHWALKIECSLYSQVRFLQIIGPLNSSGGGQTPGKLKIKLILKAGRLTFRGKRRIKRIIIYHPSMEKSCNFRDMWTNQL